MTAVKKEAMLFFQELQIKFARKEDESQLSSIFAEYGMGMPGSIEEQLIVKANGQVLAGAKIAQVSANRFFLEVMGVRSDYLGQGIGRILLGEILRNPWQCCRYLRYGATQGRGYEIGTIARGRASSFYRRMGFVPCRMEQLPSAYQEQCDCCPDKEICHPVPMIFAGGKN